jgi:hypothetical protein
VHDGGGVVAASVVDDAQLVVDAGLVERERGLLERASDRARLVVGGDDDRELQTVTDQCSTFCS